MIFLTLHTALCLRRFEKRHARRLTLIRAHKAHTLIVYYFVAYKLMIILTENCIPKGIRRDNPVLVYSQRVTGKRRGY